MRTKVNAEKKIKSVLTELKHADRQTLISRTGLDKSVVSRALRRLSMKHEIEPDVAFSDPNDPDKPVQEWRLNGLAAIVENLSTENPQRTLSNTARDAYLCAMLRNLFGPHGRMLVDQTPSVTIATSERSLIEKLAGQFESDFNTYLGVSMSKSAIRSRIRVLLKRGVIRIQRIVMLTRSEGLDKEIKRLQAEAEANSNEPVAAGERAFVHQRTCFPGIPYCAGFSPGCASASETAGRDMVGPS